MTGQRPEQDQGRLTLIEQPAQAAHRPVQTPVSDGIGKGVDPLVGEAREGNADIRCSHPRSRAEPRGQLAQGRIEIP